LHRAVWSKHIVEWWPGLVAACWYRSTEILYVGPVNTWMGDLSG